MTTTVLFYLFAGLAIASAVSMVMHKNPLYSAISLVGVFISLACTYLLLAAPFIAIVQILIYAGAIMVLVVFVILLLNLEEDKPLNRLRYLYVIGGGLGVVLLSQTLYIFYAVMRQPKLPIDETQTVGSTMGIGTAMFTEYLLPVEIVGVMLLMAIIGGVVLVRKLGPTELGLVVTEELERRNEKDADDEFRVAL